MLARILGDAASAFVAPTPEEAGERFFRTVERYGASYLQTRVYRRPGAPLTSASHWAAGGFVSRIAPAAWPGSDAFNYVCFTCNPLLTAIAESRTAYRFSDFAPRREPAFGAYWDAMAEARIQDALCSTTYGPDQMIASLHLGFHFSKFDEREARAIQTAGLVLVERLMELEEGPRDPSRLTQRERDSLFFLAEGRSDWEISEIFGISEAEVQAHFEDAQRKLGAVSRLQAVARLVHRRLL
jgi:DNA-binding CsgD family transcriptional regulator